MNKQDEFIKDSSGECLYWLNEYINDLWEYVEIMRKAEVDYDDIEMYEINIHQLQYYADLIKEERREMINELGKARTNLQSDEGIKS